MTTAKPSNGSGSIDPCVADFLSRHGIDKEDGFEVLDTIVQTSENASVTETAVSPVAPDTDTTPQPEETTIPKRRESAAAMRELRSVANAISVSISRSTLLREKLQEATRFLGLGFVSGAIALMLAFLTVSVHSVVFFAALFTLVLGLISTYRSTMIMTKLARIAKI